MTPYVFLKKRRLLNSELIIPVKQHQTVTKDMWITFNFIFNFDFQLRWKFPRYNEQYLIRCFNFLHIYGSPSWNSDYYFYSKILFSICGKITYFKITLCVMLKTNVKILMIRLVIWTLFLLCGGIYLYIENLVMLPVLLSNSFSYGN